MKILIVAYTALPNLASEPAIGWSWIEYVSQHHKVYAIVGSGNRQEVEDYVAQNPMPNVEWLFYDLPEWSRFWKPKAERIYYYLWLLGVYFKAKGWHRTARFDVIHHVNLVMYWMPSFISFLKVPMIWGPMGGGEDCPPAFYKTFSRKGQIMEWLRNIMRGRAHLDPFMHLTARQVTKGYATTEETAQKMRQLGCKDVEVMTQVALPKFEINQLGALPAPNPDTFRFISIGRLLHWKGFHLALEAFADVLKTNPDAEYWIFGDGRDFGTLKQLSESLNIGHRVKFWGNVEREDVLVHLGECNVLVHPSLHESGGWICAEAMAAGRPVLGLNIGGPAVQVTDAEGILLPANTPQQVVKDLSVAMRRLIDNPDLVRQLGAAGKIRVQQELDWQHKVNHMLGVYQQIAKSSSGQIYEENKQGYTTGADV